MKLQFSPLAFEDLQEIKEYISAELENPSAAQHTLSRILKSIRSLINFPDSGAPLSSVVNIQTDYRFVISGGYIVFYRHDRNAIFIVRVLYGKRDYMPILFGKKNTDG